MAARRILLVRHGESEIHVRPVTGGWTDLPLTDLGCRQAQQAGAAIAAQLGGAPVAVYASDLSRAVGTAEPIARALGCAVVLDPDLRELNNGVAAGLSTAEAAALQRPMTDPPGYWVPYEGGESWYDMSRRVFACMQRLAEATDVALVCVAHGGPVSAAVRWWLGLSESNDELVEFESAHASISELRVNEWGERAVVRLNDTSHLLGT